MSQGLGIRHFVQTSGAIIEGIRNVRPITVQILQGGIGLQEPVGQGLFSAVIRAGADLGALLICRYDVGVIWISKNTPIQSELHIDCSAVVSSLARIRSRYIYTYRAINFQKKE